MGGTAVVIVAAGRGQRFGAETPKQYLHLAGSPVIRHAVAAFLAHPAIDAVQPVIDPDHAGLLDAALAGLEVRPWTAGGATRRDSVRNGLSALADMAPERVLVHDAARPLVPADLIDRVLAALADAPGAIPALAVVDTLKRGDGGDRIAATVPRDGLWRAQTPQGFRYAALVAAHDALAASGGDVTDDAQVLEHAGEAVALVAGDERNLKITAPADLARMEAIMAETDTEPRAPAPTSGFRVGSGFDVHRLEAGAGVTLCGVEIAADVALIGHSDADVALHAVTDAILGAIAQGDIGSHFPPSDPRWRGAASDRFLTHACGLMRAAGHALENVDLTVICERPKIGPHRDAMRARLAEICAVPLSAVSVKATTTERLGFAGRGEGIAAQATVLLRGRP